MSIPLVVVRGHSLILTRDGRQPVVFELNAHLSPNEVGAIGAEVRGALADAFHTGRSEALEEAVKAIEGMKAPIRPRPMLATRSTARRDSAREG